MKISSLQQAISNQAEIVRFLADQGIKDLVGDYGELLTQQALGGVRMNAVNQGYDIQHPEYRRIEVKTRKWELQKDGSVRKEDRAVGFKGKEEQLEWLAHIILGTDFKVEHGKSVV